MSRQLAPDDLFGMGGLSQFGFRAGRCGLQVLSGTFPPRFVFDEVGLSASLETMQSRHFSVPAAIFLATVSYCVQVQAQKPAQSVEARLAAQNALFEES